MVSDIILFDKNILKLKIKRIQKIFFTEICDILTTFRVYVPFAARTESTYRRSRNVENGKTD